MMAVDVSRAERAGLRHRPPAELIREVAILDEERIDRDYASRGGAAGLAAARERELLEAWATLKS
jgi:hypothetical protein